MSMRYPQRMLRTPDWLRHPDPNWHWRAPEDPNTFADSPDSNPARPTTYVPAAPHRQVATLNFSQLLSELSGCTVPHIAFLDSWRPDQTTKLAGTLTSPPAV